MTITLNGHDLTITDVYDIARRNVPCTISEDARRNITRSREQFEEIAASNIPIYGVTTGYGEMVYALVDKSQETQLQTNLVRSHSAGAGRYFPEQEARAILVARLNALVRGYSAVRPELADQLLAYLNSGVTPCIPEIGSLGASGDLGPLSHIASAVIGEGYVWKDGTPTPTAQVLAEAGLAPLELKFKEGLALINGTSAMTGLGSLVAYDAHQQIRTAEIITALVLEVLQASSSAFQPEGHDIARPHRGQIDSAGNLRALLEGSALVQTHRSLREEMDAQRQGAEQDEVVVTDVYLQKAYTLRCIPQIVGAVRDTLYNTQRTLGTELNSSNDNPLFFEGREIFHGGNFHGQPVAFAMDYLAIALVQLGVVSERRTNRLLNRYLNNGMPEFLIHGDPGLKCGMAGLQYPATATVAENRSLCTPASIQSIPSNGDNQDVVSMGLIGTRKARQILDNNWIVLAVEAMAAVQAARLADAAGKLGVAGSATLKALGEQFAFLDEDRYLSDDLYRMIDHLKSGALVDAIERAGVELR
ncbi:tyrosine 2,3-aminomutase [Streptomyces sp. NPDC052727]|uniref:tyrosine 2,3-aminomutase n=1 Tax=unclassified Streptomyces TaxID=2593676 RepID=UPI003420053D